MDTTILADLSDADALWLDARAREHYRLGECSIDQGADVAQACREVSLAEARHLAANLDELQRLQRVAPLAAAHAVRALPSSEYDDVLFYFVEHVGSDTFDIDQDWRGWVECYPEPCDCELASMPFDDCGDDSEVTAIRRGDVQGGQHG